MEDEKRQVEDIDRYERMVNMIENMSAGGGIHDTASRYEKTSTAIMSANADFLMMRRKISNKDPNFSYFNNFIENIVHG